MNKYTRFLNSDLHLGSLEYIHLLDFYQLLIPKNDLSHGRVICIRPIVEAGVSADNLKEV